MGLCKLFTISRILRSAIRSEGSWDEVFHTMDNRMKCWKANPVTAPARTVLFKGCYLQFRELKRDSLILVLIYHQKESLCKH